MAGQLEIEGFPLQHDAATYRGGWILVDAVNRLAGLVFGLETGDVTSPVDVVVSSTTPVDLGLSVTVTAPAGGVLRLAVELDVEVTTSRLLTVEILVDGVAVRIRRWNPQAATLLIPTATHTFPMDITAPGQTILSGASSRVAVQAKTESGGSFTVKAGSLMVHTLFAKEN